MATLIITTSNPLKETENFNSMCMFIETFALRTKQKETKMDFKRNGEEENTNACQKRKTRKKTQIATCKIHTETKKLCEFDNGKQKQIQNEK